MRVLDQLADQLARINVSCVSRLDAPGVRLMADFADREEQKRQTKSKKTNIELGERVRLAVRRFRESDADVDYRVLRLVCHGCSQGFGPGEEALLCDLLLLQRLLSAVLVYSHRARAFRRLYLGLLSAYFSADRSAAWFAAAGSGNETLRQFLAEVRRTLPHVDPPLQRLAALSQYPTVLEQDATRIFAKSWLAGDDSTLQSVVSQLEIPGSSWFVTQTLASALESLGGLSDADYIAVLPRLLAAAHEPRYQTVRDDIYAAAVMRYAAMESRPIHAELRDALVGAWKNPWMARNDGAWGRVSDDARKMVGGWLKLELIHQFFDVLSEDGRQDRRRFEFWSKYYDKMDDVYFVLGSEAYRSDQPDLLKLRSAMEGRCLELLHAPPRTSAFVMCMGDTVVVEFSTSGNAAFLYSRALLAIEPDARAIAVGLLRVKQGQRLIHRDSGGMTWEENFRRKLSSEQSTIVADPTGTQPARMQAGSGDDAQIMTFAQLNRILVDDRRARGGRRWLIYHKNEPAILSRLKYWGFRYVPDKGWWRED